jgi:hypothetical protein
LRVDVVRQIHALNDTDSTLRKCGESLAGDRRMISARSDLAAYAH